MSIKQRGINHRRGRYGHKATRYGVALAVATVMLATQSPARAAGFNWINPGTDGLYTDPGNWLEPSGTPDGPDDTATFNLPDGNGHTVNFPTATVITERLKVFQSAVRFKGKGKTSSTYQLAAINQRNAAVIGSASGASLTIQEMTVTSNNPVRIGVAAGETGSLTTTTFSFESCLPFCTTTFLRSAWEGSSAFIVGQSGTGTLTHGGDLIQASSLVIGQNSGSMGTVISTKDFDVSGDITVADAGTATLNSSGFSTNTLTSVNGFIGKSAGSSGTADVRNWVLSGSLYIGGSDLAAGGTGVLNIVGNSTFDMFGNVILNISTVDVAQDMTIWSGSVANVSLGVLDVAGQLTVQGSPLPTLTLSGSSSTTTLRAGTLVAVPNSIDWQAGTIEITNGGLDIGIASGIGDTVTIDLDRDLIVSNTLTVAPTSTATLTLNDSTGAGLLGGVTAGQIVLGDQALSNGTVDIQGPTSVMTATGNMNVGNFGTGQVNLTAGTLNTGGASLGAKSSGAGTVALTGASSQWNDTGTVTIGSQGAGVLTLDSGATLSTTNSRAAKSLGSTATITVDDPGTSWTNSGSMRLGGDALSPGGSGSMTVNDGAVTVGGTLKVWGNFTLNVNGGSVAPAVLDVSGIVNRTGGSLDASSGTVVIRDGGTVNGDITANPSTLVTIQGPGGTWQADSDVLVSDSLSGTNTVGTLDLAGGTVTAALIDLGDQPFSGFGTLMGKVRSSDSITATGDLTLGDSSVINALNINGSIDVGTNTVTLHQLGFFGLGTETVIGPGGTLAAPNGMVLPAARTISATGGAFQGPFAAQAGSTILASLTDVSIGDASASDGYFSDGVLLATGSTVTLLDANEAVLGSRTTLGDQGISGNVAAANGAVLEFGKNIEGFGTVNTPNDPFKPLINNGSIAGNSALEPITLTGYVKGVGTLDNVIITGTDAPGFSPATVYRGSVTYAGTLEIEVGGLTPGSFDIINHSGTATLGGTLDLSLINGFAPGLGDTFQFLTAASRVGEFASVLGTDLGGGLAFDLLYGATDVTLQVISTALAGDLDGDGFVGISDLNIVLGNWNQNVPPANPLADPSGDGFVGIADLNVVLGNWNAGTPPTADGLTNVPEPGGTALLGVGAVILLRQRGYITK
jgi:T5SS/PEP-CTERM-associated repeat protein